MKVYFVSCKSHAVGPFDIRDSRNREFLQKGDICIRDTGTLLSFLLIESTKNLWDSCRCLKTVPSTALLLNANMLLFAFDGINKRKGKIEKLKEISTLFRDEKPFFHFFENIINILEYKCDYIDITIFQQIVKCGKNDSEGKCLPTNDTVHDTKRYFYEYLEETANEYFVSLYTQGMPLRDIFIEIRHEYPVEFRNALSAFLLDYPQSSIYDLGDRNLVSDINNNATAINADNDNKVAKYKNYFQSLHSNNAKTSREAKQEALLLLSIMDLIESGEIQSPTIKITFALVKTYANNTNTFAFGSNFNLGTPYYLLQNMPFWHLTPKNIDVNFTTIPKTFPIDFITKYFNDATIDSDLFELLQENDIREEFRLLLYTRYFEQISIDDIEMKMTFSSCKSTQDEIISVSSSDKTQTEHINSLPIKPDALISELFQLGVISSSTRSFCSLHKFTKVRDLMAVSMAQLQKYSYVTNPILKELNWLRKVCEISLEYKIFNQDVQNNEQIISGSKVSLTMRDIDIQINLTSLDVDSINDNDFNILARLFYKTTKDIIESFPNNMLTLFRDEKIFTSILMIILDSSDSIDYSPLDIAPCQITQLRRILITLLHNWEQIPNISMSIKRRLKKRKAQLEGSLEENNMVEQFYTLPQTILCKLQEELDFQFKFLSPQTSKIFENCRQFEELILYLYNIKSIDKLNSQNSKLALAEFSHLMRSIKSEYEAELDKVKESQRR